jgi:perosamine synthetase
MKVGDEILIPDFICDVVLHPLSKLGIKYKYYPLNDDLSPKWLEIENLLTSETKAILMIHYFGQAMDIKAFKLFCEKYNLLLIEDNAHGHGGRFNGRPLGSFGDIGISSPRKLLSIYSGGLLWSSYPQYKDFLLKEFPVLSKSYEKKQYYIFYNDFKNLIKRKLKKTHRLPYEDLRAFKEELIDDYAIDRISKEKILNSNWDEICKARQVIYEKWRTFSLDKGLEPVFNKLNNESNPWCFPAYAKDQMEAIKFFDWGWQNNVHVFSWPRLPKEIIEKNSVSVNRRRRLVCFGIG